ncbi:MAG TPA: DoxX family protein [Enhygromyxa sp.]|nr:DoxX family protein [Enhygromyxa sp.]
MNVRRRPWGLNLALWIISGLLAFLFIVSGGAKFVGMMHEQFQAWGYTRDFAVMIGIMEMLGAVGLLFKRTAGWAALGLMVIMLGAAWTHATRQEYVALTTPIAVFAALAFVAWGRGLTWRTRAPSGVVTQP